MNLFELQQRANILVQKVNEYEASLVGTEIDETDTLNQHKYADLYSLRPVLKLLFGTTVDEKLNRTLDNDLPLHVFASSAPAWNSTFNLLSYNPGPEPVNPNPDYMKMHYDLELGEGDIVSFKTVGISKYLINTNSSYGFNARPFPETVQPITFNSTSCKIYTNNSYLNLSIPPSSITTGTEVQLELKYTITGKSKLKLDVTLVIKYPSGETYTTTGTRANVGSTLTYVEAYTDTSYSWNLPAFTYSSSSVEVLKKSMSVGYKSDQHEFMNSLDIHNQYNMLQLDVKQNTVTDRDTRIKQGINYSYSTNIADALVTESQIANIFKWNTTNNEAIPNNTITINRQVPGIVCYYLGNNYNSAYTATIPYATNNINSVNYSTPAYYGAYYRNDNVNSSQVGIMSGAEACRIFMPGMNYTRGILISPQQIWQPDKKVGSDNIDKGYNWQGQAIYHELVFKNRREGISGLTHTEEAFDKSKFTIVGNPIITDNGIMSGFAAYNANYVILLDDFSINGNTFEITIGGTFNGLPTAPGNAPLLQILEKTTNARMVLYQLKVNGKLQLVAYDGTDSIYSNALAPSDLTGDFQIKLRWNIGNNISADLIQNNTVVATMSKDFSYRFTNNAIIREGFGLDGVFPGTLDLKQTQISLDGNLVFKGTKTVNDGNVDFIPTMDTVADNDPQGLATRFALAQQKPYYNDRPWFNELDELYGQDATKLVNYINQNSINVPTPITTLKPNTDLITTVGTPIFSETGVASKFSDSNYFTIDKSYFTGNYELVLYYRTPDDNSSSNTEVKILDASTFYNINKGSGGAAHIYNTTTGSTINIANAMSVQQNTYLKCVVTNRTLTASWSSDGITFTNLGSMINVDAPSQNVYLGRSQNANEAWTGTIDLSKSYIKRSTDTEPIYFAKEYTDNAATFDKSLFTLTGGLTLSDNGVLSNLDGTNKASLTELSLNVPSELTNLYVYTPEIVLNSDEDITTSYTSNPKNFSFMFNGKEDSNNNKYVSGFEIQISRSTSNLLFNSSIYNGAGQSVFSANQSFENNNSSYKARFRARYSGIVTRVDNLIQFGNLTLQFFDYQDNTWKAFNQNALMSNIFVDLDSFRYCDIGKYPQNKSAQVLSSIDLSKFKVTANGDQITLFETLTQKDITPMNDEEFYKQYKLDYNTWANALNKPL